jgi:hypothetical protein
MTTRDEIETRLLQAVVIEPSEAALRWLDQRVAQAVARPVALHRRGFAIPRLLLRPAAVIAAFVLLTGAVVGGISLLDRLLESSGMPGWQTAWDRAERLDLGQTDAGVTITLERAYADLNQALVGFTVEGLEVPASGPGPRAPLEWKAELRDPNGRSSNEWSRGGTGMGQDDTHLSAIVQTWEGAVAPVAGTWELTFTSVGYGSGEFVPGECDAGSANPACLNPPAKMVEGTWRFAFELPKPVGSVVATNASATVGQVTLHLTELRVTPSRITARVGVAVEGSQVAYWNQPATSLRHGTTSFVVNADRYILDPETGQAPDLEFQTTGGADEVSGTWEMVIPELTYGTTNEEKIHLVGPWTLTVTIP